MNQKAVRIIALVLAVIIAGGVLVVAFTSVFSLDETQFVQEAVAAAELEAAPVLLAAAENPDTGTDGPPKAPIIIGAVAVVLAVGCVVIPKIGKK